LSHLHEDLTRSARVREGVVLLTLEADAVVAHEPLEAVILGRGSFSKRLQELPQRRQVERVCFRCEYLRAVGVSHELSRVVAPTSEDYVLVVADGTPEASGDVIQGLRARSLLLSDPRQLLDVGVKRLSGVDVLTENWFNLTLMGSHFDCPNLDDTS